MSANNDYKASGNVYPGDDIRSVARSSRIEGLQNLSRSQVDGNPYSRSGGSLRTIGPGWVINRSFPRRFLKGSGVGPFPWKIRTFDANPPAGDWRVAMYPGTINNMMPSNIFDNKAFDANGTAYIVLNVETDGYQPTTAVWDVDTSPPGPFDTEVNVAPAHFKALIGLIVVNTIFQLIDSLIQASPKMVLQTLTDEPAVGRPYYDLNYTWVLTQY